MFGASVEIKDELTPALTRFVEAAENPAEIMGGVAGYLLTSTQQRFERETGPDGQKWQDLSPRTANKRSGRGRSIRGYEHILRDTTRLYTSLTTRSDATSAAAGTNDIRAGTHQFGAEIQQPERSQKLSLKRIRGKNGVRFVKAGTKGATERDVTIGAHVVRIPARPFFGINDVDREEISEIITSGLGKELK
ncbi:MAG: phage virion morphogenesis protein [Rhizobium sp.]|nr:MAG: phage virion morphogenesis protein [Rhizobium sp.]